MTTKANAANAEATLAQAAADGNKTAAAIQELGGAMRSEMELAVAQAASRKAKAIGVGKSTAKVVVAMAAGAVLTIGVQKYQARRNSNNSDMAVAQ